MGCMLEFDFGQAYVLGLKGKRVKISRNLLS